MSKAPPAPAKQPYWLVMDMHGVLIPSSEKWILNQVARETHQSIWSIYFRWFLNLHSSQLGKVPARSFYEKALNRKLTQKEFEKRIMDRYAQRGKIAPEIVYQLKRLKAKGWKLAVLSDMNTAQAAYHREHKHFELFDEVFLSCETGVMKPFPDAYGSLQKQIRARPDHIVFVDDLWFNIWSASLWGWRAVTIRGRRQLIRFLIDLE